jgi:hypothetical protein
MIGSRFLGAAVAAILAGCLGSLAGCSSADKPETVITSKAVQAASVSIVMEDANGNRMAQGTGILLSGKTVLTSAHLVAGAAKWTITSADGKIRSTGIRGLTYDWMVYNSDLAHPRKHDVGVIYLDKPITLSAYPHLASDVMANGAKSTRIYGTGASFELVDTMLSKMNNLPHSYLTNFVSTETLDTGGAVVNDKNEIVGVVSGRGDTTGKLYIARTSDLLEWLSPKVSCGVNSGSLTTRTYAVPPPKPGCDNTSSSGASGSSSGASGSSSGASGSSSGASGSSSGGSSSGDIPGSSSGGSSGSSGAADTTSGGSPGSSGAGASSGGPDTDSTGACNDGHGVCSGDCTGVNPNGPGGGGSSSGGAGPNGSSSGSDSVAGSSGSSGGGSSGGSSSGGSSSGGAGSSGSSGSLGPSTSSSSGGASSSGSSGTADNTSGGASSSSSGGGSSSGSTSSGSSSGGSSSGGGASSSSGSSDIPSASSSGSSGAGASSSGGPGTNETCTGPTDNPETCPVEPNGCSGASCGGGSPDQSIDYGFSTGGGQPLYLK